MSKIFNPDDLRKQGYTRYPKHFLNILIQNYCKDNKSSVQAGIIFYLYGKVAYGDYSCMHNGERYTIRKGQCIVKIPELAAFLGCSVYAVRKSLNELKEKNVISKKRLPYGLAIEITNYTHLFSNQHE
ncbi:MAG: hypothetical protein PHC95_06820 [Parabacteroides sp.]|nr:hypothetical protein [Parabacteroides sp.]